MGGTYRAWNDTIRRWPPPNGWYRADDGRWWAPGTGPNPPGRRPRPHPPSPTVRRDPSPRSGRLLTGDTSNGVDRSKNGTSDTSGGTTGADPQPGLGVRTTDTVLRPLATSPAVAPIHLPNKPRLITRLAVIVAGVTFGVLTSAGILAALVTAGHLDELPGIAIDRPASTSAAPIPTTDPAPIEPWTFERTAVTTPAIVSEPRPPEEPTQRVAHFGDVFRIDEITNGPAPEDGARSGLGG